VRYIGQIFHSEAHKIASVFWSYGTVRRAELHRLP